MSHAAFCQNWLIDSLLHLGKNTPDKKIQVNVLNRLSDIHNSLDTEKALQFALSASIIAQSINYNKGSITSSLSVAHTYILISNLDSATYYTKRALRHAQIEQSNRYIAAAHNNQGIIFKRRAQFDSALVYFNKALTINKSIGEKKLQAINLGNIGTIYDKKSNYTQALTHYLEALSIFEEMADRKGMANSYNNIGVIYKSINRLDKALEYFEKSMKVNTEIGDILHLAGDLNNIGLIYNKNNNSKLALTFFRRAIEINEKLDNKQWIAANCLNIGTSYYKLGEHDKARQFYERASNLSNYVKDKAGFATALFNLGTYYFKLNARIKARHNFKEALNLSIELKDQTLQLLNIQALAKLDSIEGNYKSAFVNYSKYWHLKDSLTNVEKTTLVSEMDAKYQNAKKEEQIAVLEKEKQIQALQLTREQAYNQLLIVISILVLLLLVFFFVMYKTKQKANALLSVRNQDIRDKNNEIRTKNMKLAELNATKDKFFSIISHDLKNPFQTLLFAFDALQNNYSKMSANRISEYLKRMNQAANKGYSLLVNLLEWARLQNDSIAVNKKTLSLKKVVNEVVGLNLEMAEKKSIKITYQIADNIKLYCDKYMLSTILRNLISNAIKFTPENGNISIVAKLRDDFWLIGVLDSGVGINSEDISKLFRIDIHHTTIGTGKEKGTGLGLILCQEFVEKNGGKIWVESEKNVGTEIWFSIPMLAN